MFTKVLAIVLLACALEAIPQGLQLPGLQNLQIPAGFLQSMGNIGQLVDKLRSDYSTEQAAGKLDLPTLQTDIENIVTESAPFLKNAPPQIKTLAADIQTRLQTMITNKAADATNINAIIKDFTDIGNIILTSGPGLFKPPPKTTPRSG